MPHTESYEEEVKRLEKLMGKGNAVAYLQLAGYFFAGTFGLPQNLAKANELWLKAGGLGCAAAYYHLGNAYDDGTGVEIDKKKAKYYFELAAIRTTNL
jgi:TPR repeat protein